MSFLIAEEERRLLTHFQEDAEVYFFSYGLSPKMNAIARLDFKLTNYDVIVQNISHDATVTHPTRPYQSNIDCLLKE